ncbi:MAG: glycosyltransferase [bacterium]
MRRLLVVAYYTPPLGMSGVMRVTKLCKFLPENGWRPLILTTKPAAYYHYDPKLLDDLVESRIFRTESADPARLFNRLRPARARLRPTIVRHLGKGPRLLNYLLFPDAKVGWTPFAVREGRRIIEREKPAAIFATAPPFTSLVVGSRLKAWSRLPLVLDFRDPWPTGFQLPPPWQRSALARLRRELLRHADLALAVNEGTARRAGPNVELLDNGFDPTEFELEPKRLDGFAVVHVGNLWENEQELNRVIRVLATVPDVRLYLAGRVPFESARRLGRFPFVKMLGMLDHEEVCRLMLGAGALLYVGKPGQPVGIKLYEYLGARRPVVVFGPDTGESGGLVESTGCGRWAKDEAGLGRALAEVRADPLRFSGSGRERFDRREQAKRLATRLEEIVLNSRD